MLELELEVHGQVDMEVEVGSEEGDDILCDVCKIWRRSDQWKEHIAGRCHQRKSKERRREQQRQNEQGRVRGELLEVEDRIARLNLVDARNQRLHAPGSQMCSARRVSNRS